MSKRIGIMGFYYLIDEFQSAANALKQLGWVVDFFPLLYYQHHDKSNLERDLLYFVKGEKGKLNNDKIVIASEGTEATVLLWWNIPLAKTILANLKANCKSINVYYHSQDPLSYLEIREIFNSTAHEYNIIITNNKTSADIYLKMNPHVCILPPVVDDKIHNYSKVSKYESDVSFVFDGGYDKLNTEFKKYDWNTLIKQIIADKTIKIKVYGPKFLEQEYGTSYIGELAFEDAKLVYSNSKINLSFHASLEHENLVNNRCIQIMASNGFMLVDEPLKCSQILQNGVNVVYIDQVNPIVQIKELLANANKRKTIADSGFDTSKQYTYKHWAKVLIASLVKLLPSTKKSNASNVEEVDDEPIPNPQSIVDIEVNFLLKALKLSNRPLHLYFQELSEMYKLSPFNVNTLLANSLIIPE